MSYCKFYFAATVLLFALLGCGLKEGVIIKDTKSYLWFTGNTNGAVIHIDDLEPFSLNVNSNSDRDTYFEISPGKHTIKVTVSGKEVVNRILLIENGITKEINIP